MTFVVSLVGYMPPPRYDENPWTHVLISESASPAGPWVQIDSQALSPLDTDPSEPQARDITTSQAVLAAGWYQVTFTDASAATSEPSDPVRNSLIDTVLPPSPDAIRNASPLLRQKFPAPPADAFQVADLRRLVATSIGLVSGLTWRFIDPTLPDPAPEGYVGEAVPAGLVPVAYEAVQRMAERLNVTEQPDFAAQVATGRRLRGFSAGPYSESYFAPGEFQRKGVTGRPAMDQDDALDAALWALATEDARDYFVFRSTGVSAPAGSASVMDYRKQNSGYSAGSLGGVPRGVGPDGW